MVFSFFEEVTLGVFQTYLELFSSQNTLSHDVLGLRVYSYYFLTKILGPVIIEVDYKCLSQCFVAFT